MKQETKRRSQARLGFTLIELLVVVAIIGLLASIVVIALNGARVKARNARRKEEIQQLIKALELYYNDNSVYPMQGTVGNPNNETSVTNLSSFLVPKYLASVPVDPKNQPQNYMYVWKQNGTQYGVMAPFANDGGTNCMFMSPGGSLAWFSSAPLCNF